MNTSEPKRGPGRPRNEERRRRKSKAGVIGKRLGVNESMLDLDRFVYRWVNETPGRIFSKTKEDDWDIVANDGGAVKDDSADLGNAVSQVVGTHPDGSPLRAYLVRKPKGFWEDDQKEKQEELDKQLDEIRRGNARDGSSQSDYVVDSKVS